jgi:hypothetical protein
MMAAADPEPIEARRMFRCRITNVLVGCVVGFGMLLVNGRRLDASLRTRCDGPYFYVPGPRKDDVAPGPDHGRHRPRRRDLRGTRAAGFESGLYKVGEVIFGCLVGMVVSWLMSHVWLVKRPAESAEPAG